MHRGSITLLALIVLYVFLGFSLIGVCMVKGEQWCVSEDPPHPESCFGWDEECAIRNLLGLEPDTVGDTDKMLVGQAIIAWFVGLVLLFAALGVGLSIEYSASRKLALTDESSALLKRLREVVANRESPD